MVTFEDRGEISILKVTGNLDIEQAEDLENNINDKIHKGKKLFVIELGEVHSMSSSGIRVFIATMRQLNEIGGRMILTNPSIGVLSTLKLVQMRDVFEIINKAEDAVKILEGVGPSTAP
jgi:anti-anti-sigma factor